MRSLTTIAALAAFASSRALALTAAAPDAGCEPKETALRGVVHDSTDALLPNAKLLLDGTKTLLSGDDGRFRFPCVSPGKHHLSVQAEGFATDEFDVVTPRPTDLQFTLKPSTVQIDVNVDADAATAPGTQSAGATATISGTQLQSLADDPDDLQRELQQLGAAGGGNPANTTIAVDGFQDTSKLPPKSSIAYIKINPDLFSAEYREPPFEGGRVEVYTKPGASAFHGALFATNGSPWMNARDPFSVSRAPLGKQRYGFELTGPVRKGADFALNLEHRSIDDFGVVNAVGLNSNGEPYNILQNVPEPQRLWVGQARVDWQLGAKNTLISTFSADVNHLENVGVGGTVLPEAGYDSGQTEYTVRVTDVTTISAHLMHEFRTSFSWDGETDVPQSTLPQLQVAGAFTGGGSSIGNQRARFLRTETDDDAILTLKDHSLKFGTQFFTNHHNDQQPQYFNGTYQFGGGAAPVLRADGSASSQTETISGVEQYRRALLGLPGGTPTAFTNVAGTPALSFTQVRDALYIQDDWNTGKGVHISAGLRYFLQTDPLTLSSVTPRLGVLWSPTKKGTWTLHAHAGLFAGQYLGREWAEFIREDGTARVTSIAYDPVFCAGGSTAGCDPLHGATSVIRSERTLSPHITNPLYNIDNIGGSRTLPYGWNLSFDYFFGRLWNATRTLNVNTPLDGDPTGPRPLGASLNVLQVQNSGQGHINGVFAGVEQHTLKRLQLFFGGVYINTLDNNDDDTFFQPQSAYTDAGEVAHRTGQPVWDLFGNASLTLPKKLVLSADFHGGGDAHYNLTTGFDNNGDGSFNDRPQIAAPGTPEAVQTRYGLLVASGGVGTLQRNLGVMPWQLYLDSNLQRPFTLTRNAKAEHQQTLTVNVRAANTLNHTNVTAVGGVLGSPLFGVPYQADTGRRVEAGLRYSF